VKVIAGYTLTEQTDETLPSLNDNFAKAQNLEAAMGS
jgi:hypothetical protein